MMNMEFYLQQSKFRGMNKDQWYNVYEFSRHVLPDLSNYDEDGACKLAVYMASLIQLSFCFSYSVDTCLFILET